MLASVLAVDAPTADACSCVAPHARLVSSGFGDNPLTIPRNAQIRIEWPPESIKIDEATVTLVSTAKSGPPAVAVDRKVFVTDLVKHVVLTPKSPLLAKTTYRVMAVFEKGGKPQLIGEVTTSDVIDDVAPTWSGTGTGVLDKSPAICCICNTGAPHFRLELGKDLKDNDTKPEQVVWAVWAGSATFDAKAPMLAMTEGYQGKLVLGPASMCSASGFVVPTTGKTSELWVAPIDLAGNIGTPAKVVIDLTKPVVK